ncbi:STAS domain-containing protein [Streptomyces sp. NBC_00696]|uniref:STAS domain-containing protein n=1 Tax=Streptomyces sp. NBC_00696 TaxID=2903672 RepID=UPI002E2EEE89|nr:STAS domain-containing protein [Streptomyces sp. NBC_00696]
MGMQDTNAVPGQNPHHPKPERLPLPCQHVRSYLIRGITVIELRGSIDLNNIPELQAHADTATARPGARVVMDLRPVEFLDCSTLGLLCRTRRRALERGGHLTLVCVRPWHLRILKAAGLHTLFVTLATMEAALEDRQ